MKGNYTMDWEELSSMTINCTPHNLTLGTVDISSNDFVHGITIPVTQEYILRVDTGNDEFLHELVPGFNLLRPGEYEVGDETNFRHVAEKVREFNSEGLKPYVVVSLMAAPAAAKYLEERGCEAFVVTPRAFITTDITGKRDVKGAYAFMLYREV